MAKKRVGGAQRYAARAASGASEAPARAASAARRALLPAKHLVQTARKVRFLDKVAASAKVAVGLSRRRAGIQKPTRRRAGTTLRNLQSLSSVLDEVQKDALISTKQRGKAASSRPTFGQAVHSGRVRAVVQATETVRLQQVLKHPVFKSNPIAAITNHLKSTLPSAPPTTAAPTQRQHGCMSKQQCKKQARKRKQQQHQQHGTTVMDEGDNGLLGPLSVAHDADAGMQP